MNRDLNKVTSDQKMQRPRAIWLVLMGIVTLLLIVYWLSQSLGAIRQVVRWRFNVVSNISADSVSTRLQSGQPILLIDVREVQEYEVSHLPGARNVAFSDPKRNQKVAALLKASRSDQIAVIYCSVGWRSGEVAEQLNASGDKKLLNLDGGFFYWANCGYALVDSVGQPTLKVHPFDCWWEGLVEAPVTYGQE